MTSHSWFCAFSAQQKFLLVSKRRESDRLRTLPKVIQGFDPSSKCCWLGDSPGTFLTNDWETKVSSRIKCHLSREIFLLKLYILAFLFFSFFSLEEEKEDKRMY